MQRFHGFRWLSRLGLCAAVSALLGGCDLGALDSLQPGVSTEGDVVRAMGEPGRVWDEPDGARTLEYNRQPQGVRNYMITIGSDGLLRAVRQVLTPENFQRIQPGMTNDAVRRLLGQPARQVRYELSGETVWTWKFLEQPPGEKRAFNAVFGPQMRVVRTGIGPDPDGPDMVGGGR